MYTDQIYTNFKAAIFLVLFTRKQNIELRNTNRH